MEKKYYKDVKVLEGPWANGLFEDGVEKTKEVIARRVITTFVADGYLCEEERTRTYSANGDYHDVTSHKRVMKLDD